MEKKQVEEEIGYVSQLAMNITGFINLKWQWEDDSTVIIFNGHEEGSPQDDVYELAVLIAKLTGWEIFDITPCGTYEQYGPDPFKVGLRKP